MCLFIINMTFFDGGPRCHIDTCYLYPNEKVVFGILKASPFQYDAFRGRSRCKTKKIVGETHGQIFNPEKRGEIVSTLVRCASVEEGRRDCSLPSQYGFVVGRLNCPR